MIFKVVYKVSLFFLKVNTLILFVVTSVNAQMPHALKCRGDLNVFCLKKDQWTEIKNTEGVLSFLQSDCPLFRVGGESKNPYLQFNPWMGIQHQMFPSNFKKNFNLTFRKHDEENMTIQIIGKSSDFKQSLNCMVSIDLKPLQRKEQSSRKEK
jgi:hypothetical protein